MDGLKSLLNRRIHRFDEFIRNVNERRNKNTGKFSMTCFFLTLLYPVFIVLMAELNQDKYPSKLVMFIVNKPMVMVFDIVVAAAIFAALCLLFRKVWRAVTVQSIVYFMLSITELFKYGTNGNHLIMTDMKLIRSVKSLTSFAYIKITPRLVTYTIIVLAYIAVTFWFNPKIKISFKKSLAPAIACAGAVLSLFFVTAVSTPVYSFFDVDTTAADNVFILNEKFENNSFLAFFMQTASENLANRLEEPENYTEQAISDFLGDENKNVYDVTPDADFKKPNVIVVMSEALADFRTFDELKVSDEYYAGLDRVAAEGHRGQLIVPTFASFTVRTEFELLFGLPVKSLNDPNMPQRMLAERDQPAFARYYKALGYNTAYVHPFLSSFYSRKRIYGTFGFDQMIFEDDFTVPVEYRGSYIKDETVFNQIEKLIKESDEPLYLHTTTMQNHQPYTEGASDDELLNYLDNVKVTADAFEAFISNLKKIDEPTIVFMVGDHFPSFKNTDDNVYNRLGINSATCSKVFEQNYVVWSNYGADLSAFPDEMVSTFYVPYILLDAIGAPKDTFIEAMTEKMETLPVYSTQYDSSIQADSELDVLTYDRVIGENISG